jgi:adenine deaminase
MAPSCVPASPLETPLRELTAADMADVLRRDRALGVAEMMNFPGVIAGDPGVLERLAVPGATHVDGHAPAVVGRALDAYAAAGIRSDHEAITAEEMLEKRRRGMWVLIREASNARNLDAGIELVRAHGPDYTAFCTDDREPTTLVDEGHIGGMAARAVAAGIAVEDVLAMATLHAARAHRIEDLGAIAPGYHADLLLLDDLTALRPSVVLRAGEVVARDGAAVPFEHAPAPEWTTGTVRPAPVTAGDLALGGAAARVRVIDIVPGQLLTVASEVAPLVRDGEVVADPARDLAKIAVIERHHASGQVGVGLVRGFALRSGAFASTVAHDAHNVVACGVDDASMLACVARLAELGGGVVVARDGAVVGEQPLPVAGLLADAPVEQVAAKLVELETLLAEQGVTTPTPFMTLSFLALSVIPDLKVTDQGLVDVLSATIVPLALD